MVCALGALLFTHCSEDEEVSTGKLTVSVADAENPNAGIQGALITLSNGITGTTGSDGICLFNELEPGNYDIMVSASGYRSDRQSGIAIYAGTSSATHFGLVKAPVDVTISPLSLNFGPANDMLTFTIKNNSSSTLQYNISGYNSTYLTVSPASAQIAAKGQQTVSVTVNRAYVTSNISTQLLVNIGNDSYPVSININTQDVDSKMQVSPSTLDFGTAYKELQFNIKNVGTAGNLSWSIDQPTAAGIKVTPTTGTTAMGKSSVVTVSLDRTQLTEDLQSFLTIRCEGASTSVVLTATAGGSTGGDEEEGGDNDDDVTGGQYVYFQFENDMTSRLDQVFTAVGKGSSFVSSFNGGKALKIPAGDNYLMSIPDPLIDQRSMSISFWAKDLYDGHVFHVVKSNNANAFCLTMKDGSLKFIATSYTLGYQYASAPSFTHNSLSGWHMITITSDFNATTYAQVTTKLYVDGAYVDQVTEYDNPFSEGEGMSDQKNYGAGIKFIMGGSITQAPATSLTIDNLRVYKTRKLTDEEIQRIYNYESLAH